MVNAFKEYHLSGAAIRKEEGVQNDKLYVTVSYMAANVATLFFKDFFSKFGVLAQNNVYYC